MDKPQRNSTVFSKTFKNVEGNGEKMLELRILEMIRKNLQESVTKNLLRKSWMSQGWQENQLEN